MQVQVGTLPEDREEAAGNQEVGRAVVEAWVPHGRNTLPQFSAVFYPSDHGFPNAWFLPDTSRFRKKILELWFTFMCGCETQSSCFICGESR